MANKHNLRCECCGGTMSQADGSGRLFRCDYCGSTATRSNSREAILVEQGYICLEKGEFDEADDAFTKALSEAGGNYEAHWGRALARFGVIFVKDPASGLQVPTVHKISGTGFMRDSDYSLAIAHATREKALLYRDIAMQIDKIRESQMAVSAKESPYDIFLCYKDSDKKSGIERTKDSYDCADLYVHLSRLGYKVFFSRESLREHIAEEYEPYIFNALMTAKVMIVYGSRPEYFKAVWVKNEWQRFLRQQQLGKKPPSSLIVAVGGGMDMSLLPDALRSKQCVSADARTFYTDLDHSIRKIIKADARFHAKAVTQRYCEYCGTPLAGNPQFCPTCGKKNGIIDPFERSHHQPRHTSPSPAPQTPKPPVVQTKIDKFAKVALSVAIVMVVILSLFSQTLFSGDLFFVRYIFSIFPIAWTGISIFTIAKSTTKQSRGLAIASLILSLITILTVLVPD